jgi:AraC family transcriptional regulator, transcriptional activator of pobA
MTAAASIGKSRRAAARVAPIPAFFLYGEPLQAPDERLVHVETIAARSSINDWNIRPHRHRDLHQVLLTLRGRVDVQLDGAASRIDAPGLVIVPPGCVHAFAFEQGTVGLVISFAPGLLAELSVTHAALAAHLDRPQARALARASVRETDLQALGDMLLREFLRAAPGRHAALRGLLAALLANVVRLTQAPDTQDAHGRETERELVARFRRLIELHFRTHRSMQDYAVELGASESRLRRACAAVAGQSPVEVVHLRLLVEAERLLRYTTMSVSEVAYHLGFEDPAYFSRFFARFQRLSPRDFRAGDAAAGRPIR